MIFLVNVLRCANFGHCWLGERPGTAGCRCREAKNTVNPCGLSGFWVCRIKGKSSAKTRRSDAPVWWLKHPAHLSQNRSNCPALPALTCFLVALFWNWRTCASVSSWPITPSIQPARGGHTMPRASICACVHEPRRVRLSMMNWRVTFMRAIVIQ